MTLRHAFFSALAFRLGVSLPVSEPISSQLSNTSYGPIPGQSSLYSTYDGTAAPFPANFTGAIVNTTSGPPGADDLLFQNLLAAEWIIFSFYPQGVEAFSTASFVEAGFPSTTYERIHQIRDNEAGHLRILQDQISTNSVKPGPCQYNFPFEKPVSYLVLQTIIEISSLAVVTGALALSKSEVP